jgi:hypothetical protein
LTGFLHRQHLLLQPAAVQPFPEILVGPSLGAVLLQLLAAGQQLLLHDPAALHPVLHLIELAAGLLDAGVEEGHAGQLVDDAPALLRAHRHDAGDVALHHHVAALRIHPQAAQLGLQLLQIARHSIGTEAAAVGASGGHPQAAAHTPFLLPRPDPGAFRGSFQPILGPIGLPVAQIKVNGDGGFRRLAGSQHGAVDQIGQPFGPHAAATGQAQAEQHAIQDVAFSRTIGAGHHGESGIQRDGDRAAERFEVGELDLLDVNQPARPSSPRNVAEVCGLPTPPAFPTLRKTFPTLRKRPRHRHTDQ